MSSSSFSSAKSARRVFLRQAVLILLPVLVLAGIASAAARGDRRQAEARAREHATGVARVLAVSLSGQVREGLQRYLATRNATFPPLVDAHSMKPGALSRWLGAPVEPAAVKPGAADGGDWVFPELVMTPDGHRVVPAGDAPLPTPPDWWLALEPEWREHWDAAVRLESSGAARESVVEAWRRCRKPLVNTGVPGDYPYDINVLYQIRRAESASLDPGARRDALLSFSANPSVRTPSGLPLMAVALFECLSTGPASPPPPALVQRLRQSVTEFPSFLTPVLLERALQADPGPEIRALQQRWDADERLRRLAPHLERTPAPGVTWCMVGTSAYLVAREPFLRVESAGPGETMTTNRFLQMALIPQSAVAGALEDALAASRSLVPGYAEVTVAVGGRLLKERMDPKRGIELARSSAPLGATPTMEVPLEVGIDLTNPDLLFQDQRRREIWIAVFIGLSVLASALGVLQAWKTLRQQIALHEAKSNFVSAVSHELRAPLASVRLLAEGLSRDGMGDEGKRREYGRFLVEETRRLGTLIENVLSLARLEQGRRPLEIAPTDVRLLVRETVRRFEPLAAERGVRLEFEDRTGGGMMEAAWDGLAVQQALANLLDNAMKHSPSDVAVRVVAGPVLDGDRNRIRLSVCDQGPGIPREEQERIFDRFYRRGSELRRETRGVGLGLALVREIAMAHGGRVWVESQPGQGAAFHLELPLGNPAG